ncbi:cysteine proteinase [Nadsonia fulvescens var. elongata DSM 6958]|uniref:Cysteine proteinase n=1 Tax=Nadsonia fulvescens var. elongata DSM 6958 TaxID=857566 RepID=A0A1E3PHA2_9ASCO|nr:cysteine proteinase [Nadsonia fulvescens var. elongata DSM 6958]
MPDKTSKLESAKRAVPETESLVKSDSNAQLNQSSITKRTKLSNSPDREHDQEAINEVKEVEDAEKMVITELNDNALDEMYLETIDRSRLDFDFEKLCSVSLSNNNVYACLVCGKYFQGRGKSSYAYFHSVNEDHHVYINLKALKIYLLPENYEITSNSLNDIKYVVNPTYTKEYVSKLDKTEIISQGLNRKPYHPGFIGINNIKENDYANVVIQALAHISPLRDYFMLQAFDAQSSELVKRTGSLIRKIWNPRAFKLHVSPHELLQHINLISRKRFSAVEQSDPFDFMNWLFNNLHLALGGSKTRSGSSIVQQTFQGRVKIESQKITSRADEDDKLIFNTSEEVQKSQVPFLFLSLDLPPAPLFRDAIDANNMLQVPLVSLLAKYDGSTTQELAGHRKRYKVIKLPPFLIFHVKRFSKTVSGEIERNPIVVNFPIKSLDMARYYEPTTSKETDESTLYDLRANIILEQTSVTSGKKNEWKVQLVDKSKDQWYKIQDLSISQVQKELLFLDESYIQIWERRTL